MDLKTLLTIAVGTLLTSCSTVRMTSSSTDIDAKVSAYPTIADLQVSPHRVSKTASWKWNPFNTTSLETRRGNVRAELIQQSGADILVEPEYIVHTTWLNLLGGSVTVTGYPAKLDNFRNATPEDLLAIRSVDGKGCGYDYIVLAQDDINGVIIGKTPTSQPAASSPEAPAVAIPEKVTSSVEESQQQIPGDPVTKVAPASSSHDAETLAYDRIGTNRFLTTMAREYYGNPDFWSYIYEENSHRFGHPDRIKPGTSVIIPNLKKYGVDPNNPADVEKAKLLAKEIYARYGKWI